MSATDNRKKNVITWKDADQAILRLGFYLLSNASSNLRHPGSDPIGFYPTGSNLLISNGDFSTDKTQGWWSYDPDEVRRQGLNQTPLVDIADGFPSAICWYSFQNLIRIRLAEARKAIKQARYLKKKKPTASKQSSRNAEGRKKGSKYGRKADLPEKGKP